MSDPSREVVAVALSAWRQCSAGDGVWIQPGARPHWRTRRPRV